MRVVKNAKPVSVVVGGALMIAGFLGLWLAAMPSSGPGDGRRVVFAFFFAVVALVQGVFILSWNRRTKHMALVRMQAADVIPGLLPLAVFASEIVSVPELADPTRPYLWMAALLLASAAMSVVPVEKAEPSEIPPLRPGRYLDWLRWQNFGAGTLLISFLFSALYFSYPLKSDAFAPLIVVLALAQATVSIWRIIEQRQVSKSGVHLSGLQISWLRVIHIRRGHEAAVRELRTMYPKIGPLQADSIIENLYRTEEEPPGLA